MPDANDRISLPALVSRLRGAFPTALSPAVDSCLAAIPIHPFPPSEGDVGPISVRGEVLHIPYRIYPQLPTAQAVSALDETQQLILACLLSRHHEGIERQRQVPQLLASSEEWVAPFVLQLVGEYVVEIIEVVTQHIDQLRNDRYSRFAVENPRFIAVTKRRIMSYWNEYYRRRFSRFVDYPGFKVFDALGLWDQLELRRWLMR